MNMQVEINERLNSWGGLSRLGYSKADFPQTGPCELLHRLRKHVLTALLSVWAIGVLARDVGAERNAPDPHKAIHQHVLDVWPITSLPASGTLAITESPEGYLWFGTHHGLIRFDGVRHRVFDRSTLPELRSESVSALSFDLQGLLWVGTNDGLYRIENHRAVAYDDLSRNEPIVVITLLVDRVGRVWVGTTKGLGLASADTQTRFNTVPEVPGALVTSLAEAPDGQIWMAIRERGLFSLDPVSHELHLQLSGPEFSRISRIQFDSSGTLWVSSMAGLYRLQKGREPQLQDLGVTPAPRILAMRVDETNTVWLGSHGDGLFRIVDRKIERLRVADGLPQDSINELAVDSQGSLWIASTGAGIARLRNAPVTTYTQRDGLPHDHISALHTDRRGKLWVGTWGGGLSSIDNGRFTTQATTAGQLLSDRVGALLEDRNGTLWVGTSSGVNLRSKGRWLAAPLDEGIREHAVWAIHQDRSGRVWVGTSGTGLLFWDGDKLKKFDRHFALRDVSVRTVHEDRSGALWIGTYGYGLFRLRGDQLDQPGVMAGLRPRHFLTTTETADGTLWFGTAGGGLISYSNGRFFAIGKQQGLSEDNVFSVIADNHGRLWMCGMLGLFSISVRDAEEVIKGRAARVRIKHYDRADGMKQAECNGGYQDSAAKMPDGSLWFPTTGGLAKIKPGTDSAEQMVAKTIIESVAVNHAVPQDLLGNGRQSLVLQPGVQNLEIHFTAIGPPDAHRMHFRYLLEGFDDSWVDASDRRTAYYTNLPPGRFRFLLETSHRGNPQSSKVAESLEIQILPYYYQTAWFLVSCAILAGLLVLYLHRSRLQLFSARAQLAEDRNRIARDLHDGLAQHMTGIALQLQAIRRVRREAPEQLEQLLDRIDLRFRESLEEARRAIFALRPFGLESRGLVFGLHELAARYEERDCKVEFACSGTPWLLPDDVQQHVFRIAQEGIANAIQHAACTQISLRLLFEENALSLEISDDGRGIENRLMGAQRGSGLKDIRERVCAIKGELHILSEPDAGTTVAARIPRPSNLPLWRRLYWRSA